MTERNSEDFNVDELLNSLFPPKLIELFERRILQLGITPTYALDILDIEYRALQGILHGTSKRVDVINFIKLGSFLQIPKEKVIALYFNALEANLPIGSAVSSETIDYINQNFDLATLFRAGFISSITDYKHIEGKIIEHLGLKTIFDYKLPSEGVAFSSGKRKPKDLFTRGFWISSALEAFKKLSNPYPYDQNELMEYFPEIREQSIDVEHGLMRVISALYKLGITVFYQSTLPALHLKGATLCVNNKPCIVLTDYKGFYTTLWHTLCHEISHVLFDFQEIRKNIFHISDEGADGLPLSEKERQADEFAREFLFPKDLLIKVKPHINNKKFIADFAERNQVHQSFIYTYYAWEFDKSDAKAWAKAKSTNPDFDIFIEKVQNPWTDSKSTRAHVKHLKESNIYN